MGSEGQNSPSQTSGTERKRPWEIFPEAEISAIEKKKKQLDLHERKRLRREKYRANFANIRRTTSEHKVMTSGILLIFIIVIATVSVFLFKTTLVQNNSKKTEGLPASDGVISDWPFPDVAVKDLPTPKIAHSIVTVRIAPILHEGIYDTDTINVSKFEDNYEAFIKKVDSEYEKVCYRLAMIEAMFALDSDYSSARAAFLLERFDEEKLNLNDMQYIFYLYSHISYATYKKDEALRQKYLAEYNNKYTATDGYIDFDTGEVVTDKEKIKQMEEGFEETMREIYK
jgi:hypothetical protein